MCFTGEAQAGAAGAARAALIDAVEAFENAGQGVFGDPDAGVFDGEGDIVFVGGEAKSHAAVFLVVFDAVVEQVADRLFEQVVVGFDLVPVGFRGFGDVEFEFDVRFLGLPSEIFHGTLGELRAVDGIEHQVVALFDEGEMFQVVDQVAQAARFL